MGVIETRTFRSGNSVAVRLPRELGLAAGTSLLIERVGERIELRLKHDPDAVRRDLCALVDDLADVWSDAPDHPDRGRRDPIAAPARGAR